MRAIRSGELADRAFARQVANVPERDVAFLHELVYGTLRMRGRMDYVLTTYVRKGLHSLDDDVLEILRLGSYQLIEMRSVPAYAAVSQSVELAKTLSNRGASGLVNGVLQNMRRDQEDISPPLEDTVGQLSTWGSHPRWLVERWVARYGAEAAEQIVANNNTPPDIFIRPIGLSVEEALQRVTDVKLERVGTAPDALRIVEGSVSSVLQSIPAVVQDPAAGLVARYAQARGGVVADLCAAPGGKAIELANDVRGAGIAIAADVSPGRMSRVVENAQRIGDLPLRYVVADARFPAIREADTVLIDAPCTGTGTFRRHPDGKWRVQPDDLHALVELQRSILEGASRIVKVGGILVYSTCSIEPEENEEQVRQFLDTHPNFLRRPPAAWHDERLIDDVGNLVVLPHEHGFDGSFAARMERVS